MRPVALPTTDLYFLNSCGGWIRRAWRKGLVERLGPNSFRSGGRFLLIRRDTPELMEQALAWPGQLIYLIDDDIDAAAETPSLPEAYRHKLAAFAGTHYRKLLRRADTVVVPSDNLAAQLAGDHGIADIRHITPYWGYGPANQDHFDDAAAKLTLAHLGSASHSGGLAAITPALLRLFREFPHIHLTYVGRRGLHPALEACERVRRLRPMKWPAYRRWLRRQRFHIGIYPLENTRFDRARSANKIFEHGLVGAAGLYPCDWAPAAMIGCGATHAPSDPARWHDCLREAISAPEALRGRAMAAAEVLARDSDPAIQQRFWRELFGLEANQG